MTDDIGTVRGTATYDVVRITAEDSQLRVAGEYDGDPESMIYGVDSEYLFVGGLKVHVKNGPIIIEPPTDDGFVWVKATEQKLLITRDKPPDDNAN